MAYQVVEHLAVEVISKRLVGTGIHAIPLAEPAPVTGNQRVEFDGTFDDYLAALTAAGINHVLIYHRELVDEDFQYSDFDVDDEEDEGRPAVGLDVINPKLNRFRAYVGQTELAHISAWLGYQHLYLELTPPWYVEYVTEHNIAVRLAEKKIEEAQSRKSEAEEEVEEKLLERLRALDTDPKMAKQRTQRAMLQYALLCIPELEALDPSDLKVEIQDMRARIDIRNS